MQVSWILGVHLPLPACSWKFSRQSWVFQVSNTLTHQLSAHMFAHQLALLITTCCIASCIGQPSVVHQRGLPSVLPHCFDYLMMIAAFVASHLCVVQVCPDACFRCQVSFSIQLCSNPGWIRISGREDGRYHSCRIIRAAAVPGVKR